MRPDTKTTVTTTSPAASTPSSPTAVQQARLHRHHHQQQQQQHQQPPPKGVMFPPPPPPSFVSLSLQFPAIAFSPFLLFSQAAIPTTPSLLPPSPPLLPTSAAATDRRNAKDGRDAASAAAGGGGGGGGGDHQRGTFPSSSSSPNQQPPQPQQQQQPAYYQPSIYSYHCRGAYFADSNQVGSRGTCRGFESRLELLSDLEYMTRENAIKNFTYMTDFELQEDDDASALNQKTKSILVSPALIYKDTPRGTLSGIPGKPIRSTLPEEELIKRQEWSCYGTTEVEFLTLRDVKTGHEHVAAVAPRNVGVSVRRIESNDDGSSITSIGIGWLNIVVDAGPAGFLEDDGDEGEDQNKKLSDETKKAKRQRQREQDEDRIVEDAIREGKLQDRKMSKNRPPLPEEVPPRPSTASLQRAKNAVRNFAQFTEKVGQHAYQNVHWLSDTLRDDFLQRSVAAGTRIAHHVPVTVERTYKFAHKMYDKWKQSNGGFFDGGDGGGGDDPPPRGAGGGFPPPPPPSSPSSAGGGGRRAG